MRRALYLVIASVYIAIFLSANVGAIVQPTSQFYVNDYADILSPETESFIVNNSATLAQATTAQIVVVTVKNLEGKSLESYATQLFREFGIGDKQKNNGLLLLLALEERKSRVEVGTGLEGILPDGKTGRFQDQYMIPYFRDNNFDEGILNGYKAFYAEVAKEYNYEYDESSMETVKFETSSDSSSSEDTLGGLIVLNIIYPIFLMTHRRKSFLERLKLFIMLELISGAIMAFGGFVSGTENLHIAAVVCTLLNAFFAFIFSGLKINDATGGSSGHYSGWSSGGWSSGGSSGGFSGGGGSSSGGGSSRGF